MNREVVISESKALAVTSCDGILVPRVIAAAGDQAARRFLEFLTCGGLLWLTNKLGIEVTG